MGGVLSLGGARVPKPPGRPRLTSCHSMTPLHARNLLLTICTGPATPPGPTAYRRRGGVWAGASAPQPPLPACPLGPACPLPPPHRPARASQPPVCPQPQTLLEPGLLLACSQTSRGSHMPRTSANPQPGAQSPQGLPVRTGSYKMSHNQGHGRRGHIGKTPGHPAGPPSLTPPSMTSVPWPAPTSPSAPPGSPCRPSRPSGSLA